MYKVRDVAAPNFSGSIPYAGALGEYASGAFGKLDQLGRRMTMRKDKQKQQAFENDLAQAKTYGTDKNGRKTLGQQQLDQNADQFNKGYQLDSAGLTGSFGDQPTLGRLELDWRKQGHEAEMADAAAVREAELRRLEAERRREEARQRSVAGYVAGQRGDVVPPGLLGAEYLEALDHTEDPDAGMSPYQQIQVEKNRQKMYQDAHEFLNVNLDGFRELDPANQSAAVERYVNTRQMPIIEGLGWGDGPPRLGSIARPQQDASPTSTRKQPQPQPRQPQPLPEETLSELRMLFKELENAER